MKRRKQKKRKTFKEILGPGYCKPIPYADMVKMDPERGDGEYLKRMEKK